MTEPFAFPPTYYIYTDISKYVSGCINKPQFSDFTITNRDGTKKLLAHKLILAQNKYLLTLFTSELKKDNVLIVDNLPMAEILISSLYCEKITIDFTKISTDDFCDLVQLAKEWLFPTDFISVYIFRHLFDHWKTMVERNINMIMWLDLHFGDCAELTWEAERKTRYSSYVDKYSWSGALLKAYMKEYLENNQDEIVIEMLELKCVKEISPVILIKLYFKFGCYEKLNTIKNNKALTNIKDLMKQYPPKAGTFTLKQLSILKTFDRIATSTQYLKDGSKTLIVESFKPFKATVYESIGKVDGKSKKFNSIFINPTTIINVNDKLFVKNSVYTIETIFWNTETITEGYPGEDYSIPLKGCQELPENSTVIYRIKDI